MDGFGILVLFYFIGGLLLGILRSPESHDATPKPVQRAKPDDVDELSIEDSEVDGLFFGEPLFPSELTDMED
jgi:hypothetical protein